jgi:ABC-2 type transport system permease protein
MKRHIDFYLSCMRIAILGQFQYRANNYFYMVGTILEPTIYLVVWSTIANSQGGSVGGYTTGTLAAYYVVWTLVRQMNVVLTPYDWENRIQQGQLASELLRPIHPVHNDVAYFAGWKFVQILLWLPLGAIMALIFKPVLHPNLLQVLVFLVAIWGAYLVRTVMYTSLGMITFWTTRVSAIFELIFALELILGGRLVPMTLMPDWVQRIAFYFPFQWTFFFPINALVGNMAAPDLFIGLGMQLAWILFGVVVLNTVWHFGIRRFSSVGN